MQSVNVEVLGKGDEKVKLDQGQTIADLRSLLALDSDVQAMTEDGETLTDDSVVSGDVSFVPNVEGGN